jgi:hypothetical protein
MFFVLNGCDDMNIGMIELRRKKRAKRVAVQKESLPALKIARGRVAK